MANEMTPERALESYAGGLDCSQVVFGYGAEILGLDEEIAMRIASGFGGGMFKGETCGCVTGALMAIGYAFGHCKAGESEAKEQVMAKVAEFQQEFAAINGSLLCRELLGHDISQPGEMEKVREEGLMATLCPKLACVACDLLDEIL